VPARVALGKEYIFFLKNPLSSACQGGARQRIFNFFLKNSLPSAWWLALGKAGNHSHAVPSFAECLRFLLFFKFLLFFQIFTVFSLNSQ
jgi:hypothetical protein